MLSQLTCDVRQNVMYLDLNNPFQKELGRFFDPVTDLVISVAL